MSANKSERLLNLLILLLVSRSYVPKDRIRDTIEAYQGSSDEAFDKMFERDKDELRALGVPIEVGYLDKLFEDEQGYRITRDAFELPELDFTPDEVAVLGLAARVWQHAGLARATSAALVKLKAAGADVDRDAIDALPPRLAAQEPGFDDMWEATLSHTEVAFDYRRPGQSGTKRRRLQPWGVATAQGRWYVVGLDVDRGEPRVFRLSRIDGEVERVGRPGSFEVPADTDIRALTQSLAPARPTQSAVVLARCGWATGLRRRADVTAAQVDGPDGTTRWDRLSLPYVSVESLADEILGYADVVVALEPAELLELVKNRLRSLAETAR
ncbi:MAG: WYL domain-containing protein [Actinomycetota bacterium]|nr:WYL domain-containing protein [Actinomycetota bacterium]